MIERGISRIVGRALPLRGDNIDTDRIMPARFLRAVTFEGLDMHLFEDDREQVSTHPFSNPAFRSARILLVGANFGCGSSREHAPQAIQRWGIRAIVGRSFSEIFFGNAATIGMPCATAAAEAIEALMSASEDDPTVEFVLDLKDLQIAGGVTRWPVWLPAAARDAFISGSWDATNLLLDRYDEVEAVRARLPYVVGF